MAVEVYVSVYSAKPSRAAGVREAVPTELLALHEVDGAYKETPVGYHVESDANQPEPASHSPAVQSESAGFGTLTLGALFLKPKPSRAPGALFLK